MSLSFRLVRRRSRMGKEAERAREDFEGFRFEVDRIEPDLRVTLTRFHGDAVSTTTRYRVLGEGAIYDIETKGTGPGSGLALVLGTMAGVAVWVVWVLWSLLSFWWSLRRARPG